MTRTALPHLAPDPKAAVTAAIPLPLAATGDAAATGDGTGLILLQHPLHPAAGLPLTPGPALTRVATDVPPAVGVTTIADLAVAATDAPHQGTIGPTLAPTAAHPHQTGTRVVDATGPAPSLQAIGEDTGGLGVRLDVGFPDLHPEPTGSAPGPVRQDVLSA